MKQEKIIVQQGTEIPFHNQVDYCVGTGRMSLALAEEYQKDHPDVDIYIGSMDEKLNETGYIVPGLGDAGDRIFGTK